MTAHGDQKTTGWDTSQILLISLFGAVASAALITAVIRRARAQKTAEQMTAEPGAAERDAAEPTLSAEHRQSLAPVDELDRKTSEVFILRDVVHICGMSLVVSLNVHPDLLRLPNRLRPLPSLQTPPVPPPCPSEEKETVAGAIENDADSRTSDSDSDN